MWPGLPEAHPILGGDGPTTQLGILALCGDKNSAFRVEVLGAEEPAIYDVLESPKAVSAAGEHPL